MQATLPSRLQDDYPHRRPRPLSLSRLEAAPASSSRSLHALLGTACLLALCCALLGSALTQLRSDGVLQTVIAVALVFAVLLPLTTLFHSKGLLDRRDALLVLYWEILFAVLLPYQALVAARLRLPLQDAHLLRLDACLGLHIPHLVLWTRAHPAFAAVTDFAYRCLQPLLVVAALLPVALGHRREAQRFLLGNICAVALSLPLFALLPAIGPWTTLSSMHLGVPFLATAQQHSCEALILAIRQPGPFLYRFGSALPIISFPSFHVIWAILSATALWRLRFARLPLALLTGLIVLSTMTTGWHYGVDVLAGLLLAAAAILLARRLCP